MLIDVTVLECSGYNMLCPGYVMSTDDRNFSQCQ